ncbi:MAG: tRNA (adenosine(37)-N6)-threonylcarbamoyltransferase complex transferase subunit TsaD [Myxococcales bacterium]|nr:tRNA (adenosine(37)-N6)-threonylcarbamoyltransferase complex transferase subunit TsaD [Myxococcales bacterium]
MILGIESSCDETAAAVVTRGGEVRSSVVASQVPIHARFGGVVPELASRNHLLAAEPVVQQALADAGVALDDIEAVAVTAGPGLSGCLLVGLQVAKALAWSRGIPLVAVDHIDAHVHAPFLRDAEGAGPGELAFPYVALAVSGGHTSVYRVDGPGQTTVLGQTLDDAAGEAFDKVAKMMGLPYPGGVYIDRLAKTATAPERFDLPRPMLSRGLDFSFSGLKTAVRHALDDLDDAARADDGVMADLAAAAQEAIVDVLVAKALRACEESGIARLVVAGGVASNSRLRERLTAAAAKARIAAWVTPGRYCTDNAAMVAGLGGALLEQGQGLRGAELLALDIYTTKRPPR